MVSPEAETGGNKREKLIIFCILFVFIVVFVSLGVSFIKLDTGPKFTDCQYFRAVDYYRYFFA
ncbi:MAG: hypothetical protein LWY06_10690 [Firmicutes bacterium]|nr:hypothetical protein [Bacillota bacterium]